MSKLKKTKKLNSVYSTPIILVLVLFVSIIISTACEVQQVELVPMPALDESIDASPTSTTIPEATPTATPLQSNQAIVNNLSDSGVCGANVENGGHALASGRMIYYRADGICSMLKSGERKSKLSDIENALYLNKSENFLYYISTTDYCIYKMDIDNPQQPENLGLAGAYFLTIFDNHLYYQYAIGENADQYLYRADIDGRFAEQLPIRSSSYCIDGLNIYYANIDDDNSLHQYNLLTFEIEKLSNNSVRQLNIIGDTIYYINKTTSHITRLNLPTQESTVLSDISYNYLNTNGDMLIASNGESILTMDLDGENLSVILEYNDVNNLNIASDYIFFESYLSTLNEKVFYMKTDGSELSEELPVSSLSYITDYDIENKNITVDFVKLLSNDIAVTEYMKDFEVSKSDAEEVLLETDGVYIKNTNARQRQYTFSDLTEIVLCVRTDGSIDVIGYDTTHNVFNEIYNFNNHLIINQLFNISAFRGEILTLSQYIP